MSQWYYNANGVENGPIPEDELAKQINGGELTPTTLVWRVGTKDWDQVRNFPELVGYNNVPPPLPISAKVSGRSGNALTAVIDVIPAGILALMASALVYAIGAPKYESHIWFVPVITILCLATGGAVVALLYPRVTKFPIGLAWRRFFAKFLDIQVSLLTGVVLMTVTHPNTRSAAIAIVLGTAFFVLFCFDVLGKCKSPGRYLFGIDVVDTTSMRSIQPFFMRFIKLQTIGLGLSIPIVSAVATALAYKKARGNGETAWDDQEIEIRYKHLGISRLLAGSFVIFSLLLVEGIFRHSLPFSENEVSAEATKTPERSKAEYGEKKRLSYDELTRAFTGTWVCGNEGLQVETYSENGDALVQWPKNPSAEPWRGKWMVLTYGKVGTLMTNDSGGTVESEILELSSNHQLRVYKGANQTRCTRR